MNLVRNKEDGTLARNNIKYWIHLISEYEQIKNKTHPRFRFVTDLYKAYGLKRQNFIKYYNRFKQKQSNEALLPQKRGPKYKLKRTPLFIENKVVELRNNGLNRYEIAVITRDKYKKFAPSASTIYNIFKRHNLSRLKPRMKENKRRIIKQSAGELAHIDCHYLPAGIINNDPKRYYLVAVIDDATRLVWADIVSDIKSLTIMFSVLGIFNMLKARYNITFSEVITDNGSEFGSGPNTKNKIEHPFERLLLELHIKHRYTKPYRPQTNGKIERFWRTLNEDLLEDYSFENMEEFERELAEYLAYYNEMRPHQGLNGKTPAEINKFCHRIT